MVLNAIDIADYQAGINPATVSADIIIIKATEGTSYTNPYWKTWADETLKAGKLLAFYHFTHGTNCNEEVNYFLNTLGAYANKAMLFLDFEASAVNVGGVPFAKQFLELVKNKTGKAPGIYMSLTVENQLNWSSICNDYPLWVAQYNTMSPQYGFVDRDLYGSLKYWKVITLFQNTSNGHISGWNGGLDLSIFYGDKATWNKLVASSMEVDEEMAWHPEVKWNQLGMFRINREGGINLYTNSELAFVTQENGADAVRKYGDFVVWEAKKGAVRLGTDTQWASQADGLTKINPLAVNDNAHAKCKIVADNAYTQNEPKAGAAGIKHLPKDSTWTVFGRQDKYLIVGGGADGKYVDGNKAVIVL